MNARDELADAIRAAVRVGHIGPNSVSLIQGGGSVHLTPQEATDAADRMLPWLARERADRIGIEVERDAALAEVEKLRRILAEIGDLTRYTSNTRWALRRMTLILAREAEHVG